MGAPTKNSYSGMRRRGIAFFILLAAAAGGLLWSLGIVFPRQPLEVDGARIKRGTLEITLPVNGIFETRSVDLSFDVPGRLADVRVSEGDAIRRGALIASVDDGEVRAATEQALAAALAAEREGGRAGAAVEAARRQAEGAESAHRAAQATLRQVRAGPRPEELQQAEAAVEAARAALDEAQRNLERAEQLFQTGSIAATVLDAARAQAEGARTRYRQAVAQRDIVRTPRPEAVTVATEQVRQAEAVWRVALANIRQAEFAAAAAVFHVDQTRAALRAARARLDRTGLRAPFDGIITRVYLRPGATAVPGIPVVTLVAPSGWVTADVEEADIGLIRLGQTARITADAYPGKTFSGRVTRIGHQVEVRLGSRVVRVRIDLDAGSDLRAGTGVDIELVRQTIPDALLAPAEAVVAVQNGAPHLYLIEDGTLRRREVRTGGSNDRYVAILSGIREGDLVAVAEPARLRDGLRVRVLSER